MKFNDWLLFEMQKRNLSRNALFEELTHSSNKRFVSRKLWYEVSGEGYDKLPTLQSIVNIEKALNEEYKPRFNFDDFKTADKTLVCNFCYEYKEKHLVKRIYVARSTFRKIGFCFPERYGFFDIPMTICESCYNDPKCFLRLTIPDLINEIKKSLSINNKELSKALTVEASTISRATKYSLSTPDSIKQLNPTIVRDIYSLAKRAFKDPSESSCDLSDNAFFKLAKRITCEDLSENSFVNEQKTFLCELCQRQEDSVFEAYASTQPTFLNGFLSPEKHGCFDIECRVCSSCFKHFNECDPPDYFDMLAYLTDINGREWKKKNIGAEALFAIEQEYERDELRECGDLVETPEQYIYETFTSPSLNEVKAKIFKSFFRLKDIVFPSGIPHIKKEHLSQTFQRLISRKDELIKRKLRINNSDKSYFSKADLFSSSYKTIVAVYELPTTDIRYWNIILNLAVENAAQFVCFFALDEDTVPLEPLENMLWFDVSRWPVSIVDAPFNMSEEFSIVSSESLNRPSIQNSYTQKWLWKYLIPTAANYEPKHDKHNVLVLYCELDSLPYTTPRRCLLIFEAGTERITIKFPQTSSEMSEKQFVHAAISEWKLEFQRLFSPLVDTSEVCLLFASKAGSKWLPLDEFYTELGYPDFYFEISDIHEPESKFVQFFQVKDEARHFSLCFWRFFSIYISQLADPHIFIKRAIEGFFTSPNALTLLATNWISSYNRLQAYKHSFNFMRFSEKNEFAMMSDLILTIKDSNIFLHLHPEFFVNYCVENIKPIGVKTIIWDISHISEAQDLRHARKSIMQIRKQLFIHGIRLSIETLTGISESGMYLKSTNYDYFQHFTGNWYEYFI